MICEAELGMSGQIFVEQPKTCLNQEFVDKTCYEMLCTSILLMEFISWSIYWVFVYVYKYPIPRN